MIELLRKSIQKLEEWVEKHDYKGYEPFDGLLSYLRLLTFNNNLAERILQQTVRQSPINIRSLLGVKMKDSTKGRGYMAWGYLKMFQITNDEKYKNKAIQCLDWLIKNKSPYYSNYSWGNHFPYTGRGVKLRIQEPTIVWTSLIGQVFLNAFEMFENEKYLDVANSVCDWILDLPREKTDSGICLSYVMYNQVSIHNSNMLGAAMLARTAKYRSNFIISKIANEAMQYSCAHQFSNGAWYYGEEPKYHWIDNFHTGYKLDSLKCYINNTGDKSFDEHLGMGLTYYVNTFFERTGRPKYYNNRTYPVDIQCASQAIDTLVNFSEHDETCLDLSLKVAKWTIENMQDKSGYFYYRELPFMKVKAPMIHWGQATMYKALSQLLLKIKN